MKTTRKNVKTKTATVGDILIITISSVIVQVVWWNQFFTGNY